MKTSLGLPFFGQRLNRSRATIHRTVMAAVHFTIIPCEPHAANRHMESHIFNNIVYARFEVFRTFLCVFMSVFSVFVR